MKLTAVVIFLSLIALAAPAPKITTSTLASSLFFDPNGSTGFVTVIRGTDPDSLVTTTTLFYSFCVESTATFCQQGNGVIPNTALQGEITAHSSVNNVLTVVADTSVAGFTNEICESDFGFPVNCVPTAGGPVSVSFVKTPAFDETIEGTDLIRRDHRPTGTRFDTTRQFSGHMTGTVVGLTANTESIGAILSFETLQRTGEDAAQEHTVLPGLAQILVSQGAAGQTVLRYLMR
jgi:hypothetical protein